MGFTSKLRSGYKILSCNIFKKNDFFLNKSPLSHANKKLTIANIKNISLYGPSITVKEYNSSYQLSFTSNLRSGYKILGSTLFKNLDF